MAQWEQEESQDLILSSLTENTPVDHVNSHLQVPTFAAPLQGRTVARVLNVSRGSSRLQFLDCCRPREQGVFLEAGFGSCEPHTHVIRRSITSWHVYWISYNKVCVWVSHTRDLIHVSTRDWPSYYMCVAHTHKSVSYTHLTLPTIYSV